MSNILAVGAIFDIRYAFKRLRHPPYDFSCRDEDLIDVLLILSSSNREAQECQPCCTRNNSQTSSRWKQLPIVVYYFSTCFVIVLRMSLALLLLHPPVQSNLTVPRQCRTSS